MRMSMNEKKALYAFGCPNREATVERLRCTGRGNHQGRIDLLLRKELNL